MKSLLTAFLFLFIPSLSFSELHRPGLLTDDYGIVTNQDLDEDEADCTEIKDLAHENGCMPYWQCLSTQDVKLMCEARGPEPSDDFREPGELILTIKREKPTNIKPDGISAWPIAKQPKKLAQSRGSRKDCLHLGIIRRQRRPYFWVGHRPHEIPTRRMVVVSTSQKIKHSKCGSFRNSGIDSGKCFLSLWPSHQQPYDLLDLIAEILVEQGLAKARAEFKPLSAAESASAPEPPVGPWGDSSLLLPESNPQSRSLDTDDRKEGSRWTGS